MATVFDAAAFFLERIGPMTTMRLQKLCYYAQAWSLVWEEEPLFPEPIQAWANGPVAPALYEAHKGAFKISRADLPKGDPSVFSPPQLETLEVVARDYGDKPAQWLIDLSHSEAPWRDARKGLAPGERSSTEITHAAMAEYYGGLPGNA